ncbi:CDGSH iron-sulfur domain-containing protein [Kiloniella laminariae]|uniref:CDGSH iron-sulfur domain-containing protein n=1 Tax=Kiloniella laminariae TaxID=454162 RepID=UPI00036DCEA3|nr:CDGSH iron-sulfur domain-containing protein [Kiloniella laminariae]
METPVVAEAAPAIVDLVEGKTYFWCACGRSKKQPFCDGSHKGTSFQPVSFTADKSKKHFLCQCKHSTKKPFCDGSHKHLL